MAKHLATIEREREIVKLLQEDSLSIQSLESKTGYNYYTIRNIINSLLSRGIIRVYGTVDRSKLYCFNQDSTEVEHTIPRMVNLLDKSTSKVIFLIEAVGEEDQLRSTHAAKNIVRHIARLMLIANNANHGLDVNFMLNALREEVQKDYLYLKNSAFLYEQILKEPRFWNPKFLKEMADDPDFNFVEVQRANDYYDNKE